MRLDRAFFLRVYGYEISYPGFKDAAIEALEDAGCSRAREYYGEIVLEYRKKRDKELKPVAAWYVRELEKKWKRKEGGEQQRDQKKNSSLARRREKLVGLIGKLGSR